MPTARSKKTEKAMELNKTHKLLVYIDVNLSGENIKITNKNAEAL
jgi:hypothetical protein